ncbi:MAG: hypothetical protein P8Y95_10300 [Gammaproteobacteria bacterium]
MIHAYRCALALGLALIVPLAKAEITADELIAGAIDLTRGRTSYAELSMVIHRPDWQRSSTLVAWTRGLEDALIRFVAPARDAGNATLKLAEKMWTFTPKLRSDTAASANALERNAVPATPSIRATRSRSAFAWGIVEHPARKCASGVGQGSHHHAR